MTIQVLGRGCARCDQLTETVRHAIAQAGLSCAVEHVKDPLKIAEAGVMLTPALVIDGQVKSAGKTLSVEQVVAMLGGGK